MKIYLSGRISGIDFEDAVSKFSDAEKSLRKLGHDVINPTDISKWSLEDKRYMSIARNVICDKNTDAVYMLSNWRESAGAIEEHRIAETVGKTIFYQNVEMGV